MKVFETEIEGLTISLNVYPDRGDRAYGVTYEDSYITGMTYIEASNELGWSIMHALNISGKLNV